MFGCGRGLLRSFRVTKGFDVIMRLYEPPASLRSASPFYFAKGGEFAFQHPRIPRGRFAKRAFVLRSRVPPDPDRWPRQKVVAGTNAEPDRSHLQSAHASNQTDHHVLAFVASMSLK